MRRLVYRPFVADDWSQIDGLSREAFRVAADREAWTRVGRVLVEGQEPVGGLLLHPLSQYYGGRQVQAAALQWVMISPFARARGFGRTLLDEVLAELKSAGVALAVGYPSVAAFYRRHQFDYVAARVQYSCEVSSLAATRRVGTDGGLAAQAWDPTSCDARVERCYKRFALAGTGLVARDRSWWRERILAPGGRRGVVVPARDGVGAYAIYEQVPVAGPVESFDIKCVEAVATSGAAWDALLGFFARQGAMARRLIWIGPERDPGFALALDQLDVSTAWRMLAIGRVISVETALSARGYARDLTFTLDLTVAEDPAGSRHYRVEVADGRAVVRRRRGAGARALTVSVATLASLWSGWLHPVDAARLGRLDGSASAIERLGLMFGGPAPWTCESV